MKRPIKDSSEVYTILGDVCSLGDLRIARDRWWFPISGRYLPGTVNVAGSVDLSSQKLKRFPVRFGTVSGSFICNNNLLTSLEGAPSSVGGNLNCNVNRLTSLEGAPSTVGKDFWCIENRLTSLVGVHRILRQVDGSLHIWGNKIVIGGIGLVLVERLTWLVINEHPAFEIIGAHLGQGYRGLLRCQEALHDAGFGEFAQL